MNFQPTSDALPVELGGLVERILTPNAVISRCRYLAQAHPIARRVLGHSARGVEIEAYELGEGDATVLLYGLPDPGEAVGATLVVSLLERFGASAPSLRALPVRWCVIPCLNHDDQPDGGASLRPTRKSPTRREVDWCLDAPRPETEALLRYADELRPALTMALHDEYHDAEPHPAYLAVSRPLEPATAAAVRAQLDRLGVPLDTSIAHPDMGPGFFVMADLAADYDNSTFSRLAEYGLVLICEVARYAALAPAALVEAQAHALLAALRELGLAAPPAV